jgi:hypothetical protein
VPRTGTREAAGAGCSVGLILALEDFLAIDAYLPGSFDPELDLTAAYRQHRDPHVIANHHGLARFPGQNEHRFLRCVAPKLRRPACRRWPGVIK